MPISRRPDQRAPAASVWLVAGTLAVLVGAIVVLGWWLWPTRSSGAGAPAGACERTLAAAPGSDSVALALCHAHPHARRN